MRGGGDGGLDGGRLSGEVVVVQGGGGVVVAALAVAERHQCLRHAWAVLSLVVLRTNQTVVAVNLLSSEDRIRHVGAHAEVVAANG